MGNFFAKPEGQNDDRGRSPNLWGDCPRDEIDHDFGNGFSFSDDFITMPEAKYEVTQVNNGTFHKISGHAGIAEADSGSTTTGDGVNVQLAGDEAGTTGGRGVFIKPSANTIIWMETRLTLTTVSTAPQFFWGLAQDDTALITGGATVIMDTTDCIGITTVDASNGTALALLPYGEKNGTAARSTTIGTAVDATTHKLGMKITGITKAECWFDGVKLASTSNIAAANIPIVAMTPSFVFQTDGTTQPVATIDWWSYYVRDRT